MRNTMGAYTIETLNIKTLILEPKPDDLVRKVLDRRIFPLPGDLKGDGGTFDDAWQLGVGVGIAV